MVENLGQRNAKVMFLASVVPRSTAVPSMFILAERPHCKQA